MTERHEIEEIVRDLRAQNWPVPRPLCTAAASALERLSAEATDWFRTAAKNHARAIAAEARLAEAVEALKIARDAIWSGGDTVKSIAAIDTALKVAVAGASASGSAISEDGKR